MNKVKCFDEYNNRPEYAVDDSDAEGRRKASPEGHLPRKAVSGHQRQRQALQLVSLHGHRHQSPVAGQDSEGQTALSGVLQQRAEGIGRTRTSSYGVRMLAGKLLAPGRKRGPSGYPVRLLRLYPHESVRVHPENGGRLLGRGHEEHPHSGFHP